jgi:hypothetical protein
MKSNKNIKKEDFEKDIKSNKGFLNPLKKILKKSPDNKSEQEGK